MKKRHELAAAFSAISQLGLSVAASFLIWIFIALKLKSVFSLGNYIMVIGILLGVGSAVMTFYKFYRDFTSKNDAHKGKPKE